jgi:SAM-dependent methyltransferase
VEESSVDWHTRFEQQAVWTKPLRDYLFNQIGLARAGKVLEVGCGTGAVLVDVKTRCEASPFGLDLNFDHLALASIHASRSRLLQADAYSTPFPTASFDITFCHYLLLWIEDPIQVLTEMRRITRPGGHVLALAEPDYGGRMDYPFELETLGTWQKESLRNQGADPRIGRQLAKFFVQAGLVNVQTGLLGGEWKIPPSSAGWTSEWEILEHDLQYLVQPPSQAQVEALKEVEKKAQADGSRILFVPTFYAWGRK